jgi:hypothetical protein
MMPDLCAAEETIFARQVALLAARMLDELRAVGWCKGTTVNDLGQKCLVGALTETPDLQYLRNSDLSYEVLGALTQVVKAQYPGRESALGSRVVNLTCFNDHADTIWEDVERVLEKVIAG